MDVSHKELHMMRTISTKLFIAGLPFTFTEQQLSQMMGPCGSVLSAKIVMLSDLTGCPAALGLVEMSDPGAVRKALIALDRNPLDGQCLDSFVGESDGDSASSWLRRVKHA